LPETTPSARHRALAHRVLRPEVIALVLHYKPPVAEGHGQAVVSASGVVALLDVATEFLDLAEEAAPRVAAWRG
jgi:hypothetical protein